MKVTADDVQRIARSPVMAKAIAELINDAANYKFAEAVAGAQVINDFAAPDNYEQRRIFDLAIALAK